MPGTSLFFTGSPGLFSEVCSYFRINICVFSPRTPVDCKTRAAERPSDSLDAHGVGGLGLPWSRERGCACAWGMLGGSMGRAAGGSAGGPGGCRGSRGAVGCRGEQKGSGGVGVRRGAWWHRGNGDAVGVCAQRAAVREPRTPSCSQTLSKQKSGASAGLPGPDRAASPPIPLADSM